MTEISATIKDRDVGEIEIFDIGDVETSTNTVDLDHDYHDVDDHEGKDKLPLQIDLSGNHKELILD